MLTTTKFNTMFEVYLGSCFHALDLVCDVSMVFIGRRHQLSEGRLVTLLLHCWMWHQQMVVCIQHVQLMMTSMTICVLR